MANYTSISEEYAQKILDIYQLPHLKTISPLSSGISNSNYKVEFEENGHSPIILKISNDKGEEQLQAEHKILFALNNWGVDAIILPLQTKDGESTYHYQKNCGAIYPFVQGNIPAINQKSCREIATALATLHKASEGQSGHKLRQYQSIGQYYDKIQNYLTSEQALADYKSQVRDLLPLKRLQELASMNLAQGLIHGDLYYDNTMFREERLVCLLDFEQSGLGNFIYDIGISISGTCLNPQMKLDPHLIDIFLSSYEKVRRLEAKEREVINEHILLGLFSIALWRIYRFNQKQLDPKKKDNYKELLTRAKDFHQLRYHYAPKN